jgi:hypothetical protein
MIENYGFSMFAFQVARLLILAGCYYMASETFTVLELLQGYGKVKTAVVILVSFVHYFCLVYSFDTFMDYFYDCEALTPFDALFLLDDESNISNVIGVVFFEQFEFESMKKYLVAKTEDLHKCRSKLAVKFGLYWF